MLKLLPHFSTALPHLHQSMHGCRHIRRASQRLVLPSWGRELPRVGLWAAIVTSSAQVRLALWKKHHNASQRHGISTGEASRRCLSSHGQPHSVA